MKKIQLITFSFLFIFVSNIFSQKEKVVIFSVNATGSVQLLADNIRIIMNLGVENTDPQKAFEYHKLKEQKILKLIKKYGISDKDISYSLFKISKYHDFRDKKVSFKTNQSVQFNLKNLTQYTPLQIDFLKNSFYKFSSNFSTSKRKEGHEKSVKNALQNAKEEAELYSNNLNLKVGKIIKIETNNPIIFPRDNMIFKAELNPANGLLNVPQYITITTNIRVVYNLVGK